MKLTHWRKTTTYKIISDAGGNRYQFFCDVSGALACTTKPYKAETPDKELELAWESEGRKNFNKCHKCGRWTIDAVYNAEVFECVECAPYESEPKYCKSCGEKIKEKTKLCPKCGKPLLYEGGTDKDD